MENNGYKERLSLVIQSAYVEYKVLAVDIPHRQNGLVKTYLWLSSLILAFDLKVYSDLLQLRYAIYFFNKMPTALFYHIAGIALILSLIAFALATDSMRGRGVTKLPLGGDINLFTQWAHSDVNGGGYKTYVSLIASINKAMTNEAKLVSKRGKILRITSLCCLFSIVLSLLSFWVFTLGPEAGHL